MVGGAVHFDGPSQQGLRHGMQKPVGGLPEAFVYLAGRIFRNVKGLEGKFAVETLDAGVHAAEDRAVEADQVVDQAVERAGGGGEI